VPFSSPDDVDGRLSARLVEVEAEGRLLASRGAGAAAVAAAAAVALAAEAFLD